MAGTVPLTSQPRTPAATSSSAAGAAVEATTSVAAAAAGGMALSAEEEAFKRNTDCVYFLASPLTCKKGSECEYRHSDIARVNPRDCWYWLHGNCLNPKCAFRHPPLDGLLGNQMPNHAGVPGPASQPAIMQTAPASFASGKQPVACIFFQKGSCLKGDWCPFFHGPNSANNKVMQSQAAIPATEPAMFKKFGLEKCTQEKKATQTIQKPVELITPAKLSHKVESTPAKQGFNSDKKFCHSSGTVELHGYRPVDARLANDGSRIPLASRMQPTLQVNSHANALNGKDAEEVSREPSPGFDVLVNNELGDSDYYHCEDQFVRARDHEGMVEYFDNQSGDYSSRGDADRDLYHDSRAYDSYERIRGQYATEPRKSSERMSGGLTHQDRRRYGRANSPDQVQQQSDLRLRLSKHRRGNGLRSVINHDHARERSDDRRPQGFQRDPGHDRERQETSLSSRLRGRIKIPGSLTSVTDGKDQRLDREVERGRDHRRSSPGRSQASSRVRDRIKGLVQEGISNDDRNDRGLHMRRDLMGDITTHFAAPKSLAELRGRRNADGSDQQLVGKRKYSKTDYQQQTGDDLSFEGPKPLEEILKRKRRSGMAEFEVNQSNNQDTIEETRDFASSKNNSSLPILKNEDYKSAEVKSVSEGVPSADAKHTNDAEVEEGMIVEDGAAEDQEPESYDHEDEEFDYEQGDGDNFNLDDAEEEYLDDDDDEFAKKLGVMY